MPQHSVQMKLGGYLKMDTKQKMAVAGSGLLVASIGFGVVGVALIVPAAARAGCAVDRQRADGLSDKVEGASKTHGMVAGTLHRSFNAAKRAGVAEIKRDRSNERNIGG
jgi:hypothetical protein